MSLSTRTKEILPASWMRFGSCWVIAVLAIARRAPEPSRGLELDATAAAPYLG